jgi:O-antigen/teichoic acid export membrane protein
MKRSLTQQTVAGMAWMIYGKVAFAILQLVILGILARLLVPADFGVIAAAEVVIGFSAIVSQLGLGPALVQRAELEDRHIETAFSASVVLGLLLGAIIWFGAGLAAQFLHMPAMVPVLHVLAWVFPIQGLQTVASSLMSRELRFRWLANLDVVTYAIGYGVIGVTTALLHWGVWALVAAQMAQTLLKTIVLLTQYPPRFRHFADRAAFGDLMYFGGGFTMARIANYVALNGDDMTVGRFLGPTALGYYGRAYALGEFWEAHRPAVLLTAATFPPVYVATTVLRHFESPPVMTVIAVATLALAVGCALILTAPPIFLGADGQWMLETLRTFIRRLRPAPAVEPAAAVTVE